MFQIEKGIKKKALKVVIYGPEGVGKSTLASNFPNPLFIDTEDSTVHMDVNRLKRPSSFTEITQMLNWVKQEKPCSTLVIDTADWAQRLVEDQVLQENGWKSLEDPGYGNGYARSREKWGNFLDDLTGVVDAGINIVLVAHSEVKKFDDPKEAVSYDRYELKLAKRSNANIAALTKEWADIILFINYKTYAVKKEGMGNNYVAQGGERKIFTEHHPAFDAKNRFGLPESMPLSYEGIAHVVPDMQVNQASTQQPDTQPQAQALPQVQQPQQAEQTNQQPPQQEQMIFDPQEVVGDMQEAESKISSVLPKQLVDLMLASDVTEDEIRGVMGVRGHYPINTPFENIANNQPEYFTGGLAANWEHLLPVVEDIRNNPNQLVDLYHKAGEANPEEIVKNLNIKGAN